MSKFYSNSEIWQMAERNELEPGTLIQDLEENIFIFTGKSFQLYIEPETEGRYFGFCVDDLWEIFGFDKTALE